MTVPHNLNTHRDLLMSRSRRGGERLTLRASPRRGARSGDMLRGRRGLRDMERSLHQRRPQRRIIRLGGLTKIEVDMMMDGQE